MRIVLKENQSYSRTSSLPKSKWEDEIKNRAAISGK